MPPSRREAVPDNSHADQDLDDEFEQEDLHMTAEELRNLWRSAREGQAATSPRASSAGDKARAGSPEEEALSSGERTVTRAAFPPPPPGLLPQNVVPDQPPLQQESAFPPLPPVPPPPTSFLPGAPRAAQQFTASLHSDEAAFPQPAARPTPQLPSQQEKLFSRQRSLPPLTQALSPGVSSSDIAAERFGWASFRHRSRWFLPTVLVLLSFVLVAIVSLDGGAHLPLQALGPMFFIFAAIGILQAGALYYADVNANDTVWVLAVAGGCLAFLAAACFALFSTAFAFFVTILLLIVGCLLLRRYSCVVRAGTAVVMGRFGKPTRTLYAGFNLRSPGEKMLGSVETGQRRYEIPLAPLRLHSGEQVKLRVSALYAVIPGQEHLAIRNTKNWNLPIQQRLTAVVEEVVGTLSAADFMLPSAENQADLPLSRTADAGAVNAPLAALNDELRNALQEQVAERGVEVQAVRVHLLDRPRAPGGARQSPLTAQLAHSPVSSHPMLPLPADQAGTGRVVEGSGQALPYFVLPPPMITHVAGMAAPSAGGQQAGASEDIAQLFMGKGAGQGLPLIPPSGMGVGFSGMNPAPPLLSLRQLKQFYTDIVQQQITDGSTIRRIIAQFDAVAADEALSEQAPFDAAGAARNLRHYLASLERRAAPPASSPDASSPPPQGQ
jgi:hypothetical protein